MIETYLSSRQTLKGGGHHHGHPAPAPGGRAEPHPLVGPIIRLPAYWFLTKTDKLSKTKLIKQQAAIIKALAVAKEDVILFSAKTRRGQGCRLGCYFVPDFGQRRSYKTEASLRFKERK